MKKLWVIGLLLIQQVLPAQINDPNAQLREVASFTGINVSSAFNVYLSQATEDAVAVSAITEKDRDMITTEVKNGVLFIGLKKEWKWTKGNKKLRAYISFRTLNLLHVSGACDVFIQGTLKADALRIEQSGASDLKGRLEAEKLTIQLSGASDMTVTGTVNRLDLDVSGASDFKGYDLAAANCYVKASGASDVHITVNEELNAEVSGACDVKYKGECRTREIKTTGSSSVKRTGR